MIMPKSTVVIVIPMLAQSMVSRKLSPRRVLYAVRGRMAVKRLIMHELKPMIPKAQQSVVALQFVRSPNWWNAERRAFILILNPRATTIEIAIEEISAALRLI